jgi:hypothetical protein
VSESPCKLGLEVLFTSETYAIKSEISCYFFGWNNFTTVQSLASGFEKKCLGADISFEQNSWGDFDFEFGKAFQKDYREFLCMSFSKLSVRLWTEIGEEAWIVGVYFCYYIFSLVLMICYYFVEIRLKKDVKSLLGLMGEIFISLYSESFD